MKKQGSERAGFGGGYRYETLFEYRLNLNSMGNGGSKQVVVVLETCPSSSSRGEKAASRGAQEGTQVVNSVHEEVSEESSSCPVPEELRAGAVGHKGKLFGEFDVYSRRVDVVEGERGGRSANNIPGNLSSALPSPGQMKPLSTHRESSGIAKGGSAMGTWTYPSPQMFYNALVRKGKAGDVSESDMDTVVATHNRMNERTWEAVKLWEMLHCEECRSGPRLLRFEGKPDELSGRAMLRMLGGAPRPFDRHDWYVDRCGEQVRYVIDFYFDERNAGDPERQFWMDVRPAPDSFAAALDVIKMNIYAGFAAAGLPCPVSLKKGSIGAAIYDQRDQEGDRAAS